MFVVFEGIDGSGKGTQAKEAYEFLAYAFGKVRLMKYPDRSTPIGGIIDRWLHGEIVVHEAVPSENDGSTGYYTPVAPTTQGLILQAILTANKIEVARQLKVLRTYGHVVADRYTGSAVAYGTADGLDFDYMLQNHHYPLERPDRFILLDIPVDVALERIKSRVGDDTYGSVRERLVVARESYLKMAERDPERWTVINGTLAVEEVTRRVRLVIEDLYKAGL